MSLSPDSETGVAFVIERATKTTAFTAASRIWRLRAGMVAEAHR